MTDEESLRQAIHEHVALKAHDPQWKVLFAAEQARLMNLFVQIRAVEHIGSTAIDGVTAKPVIDMLAGVADMRLAKALAAPLCANGYTTSAEFNASLMDRQWFMRHAGGHRTHHLHVVVHEGAVWKERLKFRDALRADSGLAARYVQLKQRVASEHAQDREAYTLAKTAFVQAVVAS